MPAINDGLSRILRPIDITRIQRLDIAVFPVFPESLVAYVQLGAYTFDGIDHFGSHVGFISLISIKLLD